MPGWKSLAEWKSHRINDRVGLLLTPEGEPPTELTMAIVAMVGTVYQIWKRTPIPHQKLMLETALSRLEDAVLKLEELQVQDDL